MADSKRHFVNIVGFQADSDIARLRSSLKREFSQFGEVTKIYVQENLQFAKVYLESIENCEVAVKALRNNDFGWKVTIPTDRETPSQNFNSQSDFSSRSSNHSNELNHHSFREKYSSLNDKKEMDDGYLEDDFSENLEYCNVHGHPLVVFEGDTGDIYINLKDIKRTGFALFRRDTFNSLLVDQQQIHKEFELHLLSEAKNYILKNRVSCIDEDTILQTIERCKERLLNKSSASQKPFTRTIHQTTKTDNAFMENNNRNQPEPFTRPPKTPANKFVPSAAYSNQIVENRRNNDNNRNFDESEFNKPYSNRGNNNSNFPRNDSKARDFNKGDFNKDGFNRGESNKDGFNRGESNKDGFNKGGFNTDGFNKGGFNKGGSNRDGFNKGGFNKGGFNKDGLNKGGFNEDGFNKGGFNEDGFNGGDFNKGGFNKGSSSIGDGNRNNSNRNNGAIKKDFNKGFNANPQTKKISESTIKKDTMEIGKIYKVTISYVEPDKDSIYWVQKSESLDLVNNLLLDIAELEPSVEIVTNPTQGDLVLGEFEEAWCRAEVVNPNEKLVRFIDYGNRSVADSMKRIPDKVKDIPALAIRVVVSRGSAKLLQVDDEVSIKIKQLYDNGTLLVELQSNKTNQKIDTIEVAKPSPTVSEQVVEVPKPSQTQHIEKVEVKTKREDAQLDKNTEPEPSTTYHLNSEPFESLKDGDKVMFVDRQGSKLAVKTKRGVDKSRELVAYIKEFDKSAMHLTNISKGQLVLYDKEGCVGLCRGVVTEIDQNAVTVKCVDYSGEDKILSQQLRNVNEYLAKQPSYLTITPDLPYLENLSMSGINFITELVGRKEKAVVVMTDNGIDFQLQSNVLLSQSLLEKSPNTVKKVESPKQSTSKIPVEPTTKSVQLEKEKSPSTPKSSEPVLYDDMDWIKISPGEHEFICYFVKDAEDITLVSTSEESVKHMEKVAEIEDPYKEPYKPNLFEMCLVYYLEDSEGQTKQYLSKRINSIRMMLKMGKLMRRQSQNIPLTTTTNSTLTMLKWLPKKPITLKGFWYRGVVVDIDGEEYNVLMVDFGNQTTVKCDKIRKFPHKLKEVPILGVSCMFEGIPVSSKTTEKLKELMPQNENVKATILRFSEADLKYTIEIPQVQQVLKDEGLC